MEEEIKVIGRTSKGGNEYYQTAIHENGESRFIPVFLKKSLKESGKTIEELKTSKERKVDSRGVVYTLYTIPAKNVFMPIDEVSKQVEKAIITR